MFPVMWIKATEESFAEEERKSEGRESLALQEVEPP
jgi:hypothetical protein